MDLVHYVYYKQLGATKVCFSLKVEVNQSIDLEKGAYSLVFSNGCLFRISMASMYSYSGNQP